MAKKKKAKKNRILQSETKAAETKAFEAVKPGGGMYAVRETIESIVIAFVLAFLFRTFEAEAFVIPTGSMSPSLQGQHKDVCCSECGYRFRGTASSEGENSQQMMAQLRNPNLNPGQRQALEQDLMSLQVVTAMCPMCRQTVAMRPDLPPGVPNFVNTEGVEAETSYPGDRILVNKYSYNHRAPDRWDVVVFKFPGNGEMNYIKRLIGLPNETLQVYQGDIFIRDDLQEGADFQIERKPANKIQAMLQPVHDTDYDPNILYNAGWPLRWTAANEEGWQVVAKPGKQTVEQQFRVESPQAATEAPIAWLRYQHYVPRDLDWTLAREYQATGNYPGISKEQWLKESKPELVRDFNPYNTSRLRGGSRRNQVNGHGRLPSGILDRGQSWETPEDNYGSNWVGDLALECEVTVEQAQGELVLDLVEAGKHFACRIDLQTGEATVGVEGFEDYSATAKTPVDSTGSYHLRFANVDDQLLLWVDNELVKLSESGEGVLYDADQVFGERKNAIPASNESDLGDLAPARIGARGATLQVNRLQILRDIYYVATSWKQAHTKSDFPRAVPGNIRQLFADPDSWSLFLEREKVDFPINKEQLFVMGDNSPQSEDCRLWARVRSNGTKPGGAYLDRRLLIGKAVCVFWPHSWGGIPGASKLPGFPNFGDMRIVR